VEHHQAHNMTFQRGLIPDTGTDNQTDNNW